MNIAFGRAPELLIQTLSPDFPNFDLGDLRQRIGCLEPDQRLGFDVGNNEKFEILEYREQENELRVRKIRNNVAEFSSIRGYGVETNAEPGTTIGIGVAKIKTKNILSRNQNAIGGFFTIRVVN